MKRLAFLAALLLPVTASADWWNTPAPAGSQTLVTATGTTTPRTLADRFAEVVSVLDYGAVCDSATDDSAAFSLAVARVNTLHASGVQAVLQLPAGVCYLNAPITQFATHVPGKVRGQGDLKSFVVVGPDFSGPVFSWTEAWGLTPPFSGTYPATTSWNGPAASDFALVASTTATNTQQALVFYDRNDYVLVQNVSMFYFNGGCLSIGTTRTVSQAYMRESKFYNMRLLSCGSASSPAMLLSTAGSTPGMDATNEVSFHDFDFIASNGKSLVINNNSVGTQRLLRFYGLRLESGVDDFLTFGDASYTGVVTNIQIYGLEANAVPSGKAAIRFTGPSTAAAPSGITIAGNIGSGSGGGIAIDAANGAIGFSGAIETSGTDVSIASTSTVAGPISLDGGGSEYRWSTSIDTTILPYVRLPSPRWGNPGGNAAIVANYHDGTPGRGNAIPAGSVDLQSQRNNASQTASGSYATIGGGEANTADGGDATVVGGATNRAASFRSTVLGGYNNLVTGQYASVGGWGAFTFLFGDSCRASGNLAAQGDSQFCDRVLRGTGNTASAIRLTADGNAAGSLNCSNLPNSSGRAIDVTLLAWDATNTAKSYVAQWGGGTVAHIVTRGVNAASTLIDGVSTDISPDATRSNGTLTGASAKIAADTTNGCVNVSFTPPTGNTDTWRVVASIRSVEMQ